jgi:DNA-binding MarR family transcriptional regulator
MDTHNPTIAEARPTDRLADLQNVIRLAEQRGMTMKHLRVFLDVASNPRPTVYKAMLHGRPPMTHPELSRTVAFLEDIKLVSRAETMQDRRTRCLVLGPKGQAFYQHILQYVDPEGAI